MSQPAESQWIELPEWARPWLSGVLPTGRMEQIPIGSPHSPSQGSSRRLPTDSPSLTSSLSYVSMNSEGIENFTKCPGPRIIVRPSQHRTVSRALKGVHLFVSEDLRNSELKSGPS